MACTIQNNSLHHLLKLPGGWREQRRSEVRWYQQGYFSPPGFVFQPLSEFGWWGWRQQLSHCAASLENTQLSERHREAIKDERKRGLKRRITPVGCLLQVGDVLMLLWVIISSLFSLSSLASLVTVTTKGCLWGTIAMPGKRSPQMWTITMTSKKSWERKCVSTKGPKFGPFLPPLLKFVGILQRFVHVCVSSWSVATF